MEVRSTIIRRLSDYLEENYTGPIAIHRETSTDALLPPYAVIRVGSAEEMAPGQVEIWDMNVLVAVFHDMEDTAAEVAEEQAGELFAALADDPDDVMSFCNDVLAFSAWERNGNEASVNEKSWQHVTAFHAIVAPQF